MTREEMVAACQRRDRSYIGKFYLAVKSTKIVLSSGLFVQGSLREKHGVLRYVGGCFGRRLPAMQALYERNVEVIKHGKCNCIV